eukprot:scaffold271_cov336-Pavlova_lutheri.AAC.18
MGSIDVKGKGWTNNGGMENGSSIVDDALGSAPSREGMQRRTRKRIEDRNRWVPTQRPFTAP